jgi:enoyl-CoA hydratase
MDAWIDRDDDYPHVAHLRLDVGELNLLTPTAIESLATTLEAVPDDASVVTIGDGSDGDDVGGVSAGLDLGAVREFDPHEARAVIERLYETLERVRDLRAVTVCDCGGYALGAGLELAVACDFRVATDDAVLGLPEIDVGLVTGIQGGLLIRLVGLQTAKELIFTGEPVSGTEAVDVGLVNRTGPVETYDDELDDLIETLASKPPQITKWQTDVFRAWRSLGVETGIASSRETIALCFGTDAQWNGMGAFLDGDE